MIHYTYTVIRYVHDAGAGESLNIGVVLCAPSVPYLGCRIEQHYRRLSEAFADFDGTHFRRIVGRISSSIAGLRSVLVNSPLVDLGKPVDAVSAMHSILPDRDLSFQYGEQKSGLTDDPCSEIDKLFDRYVASQAPSREDAARSDEQVWRVFRSSFDRRELPSFQESEVKTSTYEHRFEHTFRNGKLHVLQPVSFDYSKPEYIQEKAAKWVGRGVALSDSKDLGKVYFLLGRPSLAQNRVAYNKAKLLLRKMPVEKELIDEEDMDTFASKLEQMLKEH